MTLRALHVAERNAVSYRRNWRYLATGVVEPFLYLLSIGIGVGALVGTVPVSGHEVSYQKFVAPALLASSAMNGAVFDATFNFFFKIKYAHTFDAMLATPLGVGDVALGEMGWSLARSTLYALCFLLTMTAFGLTASWWAVLALPSATLIGLAFAGVGMATTTYMRSWVHFDYVNLVLIPLFLFSATFFPISRYPEALRWVVRATPLYQGVALERGLVLGDVSWALLGHAVYLLVMGALALRVAAARLQRMLLP
ncbi:MAG: lipooligosaccharide transport system permease protein [Actinomycetota bacterium]|jgi:lipooligosaccharide transport system permease protein